MGDLKQAANWRYQLVASGNSILLHLLTFQKSLGEVWALAMCFMLAWLMCIHR